MSDGQDKDMEDGIIGYVIDVEEQPYHGRKTIFVKIKDDERNVHELKNNWDGSETCHDNRYGERLKDAKRFYENKTKVLTKVWLGYNKHEWFAELIDISE